MPNGGKLTIRTRLDNFTPATGDKPGPALRLPVRHRHRLRHSAGDPAPHLRTIFHHERSRQDTGRPELATVDGIVQQHHGAHHRAERSGQRFGFNVGFSGRSRDRESPCAIPAPTRCCRWGDETILLVEDEFPLRTFVSDLLQRCGYTVLEAESGSAALKVWSHQRDQIQLLLTDIIMPET
jgi:two-component system cell cycle sensor histidine kinase/response regulator CckA